MKLATIYISTNADGGVCGWASSRGMDSEIEISIDDQDSFFSDNPFLYTYTNGNLIKSDVLTLARAKFDKMNELDTICNQIIVGTFPYTYSDGVTYYFWNDTNAQGNFDKVLNAFDKGFITAINWTSYDAQGNTCRLYFDATTYTDLYKAHLTHIQSNIIELRDFLEPQVNAITIQNGDLQTAINQVNVIAWLTFLPGETTISVGGSCEMMVTPSS